MRRRQPKRITARTEDDLQIQVATYLNRFHQSLLWWHTPNGGSRNVIEAAKLKGMGTRPGVADVLVVGREGRLLAIELKFGRGRQSPGQIEYQAKLEERGGRYALARSVEEVRATILNWEAEGLL